MGKRRLLVISNNSLIRQALSSVLVGSGELVLIEGRAQDFKELTDEVMKTNPDILVLDDAFPYTKDPLLVRLPIVKPGLPVIVVSKEENLLHVVRQEIIHLESPDDLINAIDLI